MSPREAHVLGSEARFRGGEWLEEVGHWGHGLGPISVSCPLPIPTPPPSPLP